MANKLFYVLIFFIPLNILAQKPTISDLINLTKCKTQQCFIDSTNQLGFNFEVDSKDKDLYFCEQKNFEGYGRPNNNSMTIFAKSEDSVGVGIATLDTIYFEELVHQNAKMGFVQTYTDSDFTEANSPHCWYPVAYYASKKYPGIYIRTQKVLPTIVIGEEGRKSALNSIEIDNYTFKENYYQYIIK